jgi:hypothetical protein
MGRHDRKKDHARTDAKTRARKRDLEQPVIGSVTGDRAQATSNLTDGNLAGPDWKRKDRAERG